MIAQKFSIVGCSKADRECSFARSRLCAAAPIFNNDDSLERLIKEILDVESPPMPFTAHHHGTDKLGLAALLEAFANDQWIGEHYTEEQAVEAVMDRFKRLVEAELALVELKCLQFAKPQDT